MVDSIIRPSHFKWVIIKNKNYDLMRTYLKYENFKDLKHVDADAINVRNSIIEMGGRAQDIETHEDIDSEAFKKLFNKLKNIIYNNWAERQEYTLVFVYYAGHGLMTETTNALCNGFRQKNGQKGKYSKTRYNLEHRLRSLGMEEGGYILGIFDCCRERISQDKRD